MTIIGLVAAGLGVSILPASLNGYSCVKCAGCHRRTGCGFEMWLVWSKHHEQSHAAQRFKSSLCRLCRAV
jgi:DNA-binding transcriptional LysR family regulator